MTVIITKPGSDASRLISKIFAMFKATPREERAFTEWVMDEPTSLVLRHIWCENYGYGTCTCAWRDETWNGHILGRPVVIAQGAALTLRQIGGERP